VAAGRIPSHLRRHGGKPGQLLNLVKSSADWLPAAGHKLNKSI